MRVTGLSSGLDVDDLVSKLMAIERQPLAVLQTREARQQARLAAWNTIDARLQGLFTTARDFDDQAFRTLKADSTADAVGASVVSSDAAVTGTYAVTVDYLAQAHRVASDQKATDYTVSATGGGSFSIVTTSAIGQVTTTSIAVQEGASLKDLASAINSSETGVTATLIDNRLVLERAETGSHSSIGFQDTAGGLLATELGIINPDGSIKNELVAGRDAAFAVNGLNVTRSSNEVDDVVEGLRFTLNNPTTGEAKVTVSPDTSAVTKQVNALVDAYNGATRTIKDQLSSEGRLRGDALLIGLRSRLRLAVSNPVGGLADGYDRLAAIGITTGKDGTLTMDTAVLLEAYGENPQGLSDLFASDNGVFSRLEELLDPYVETEGLLETHGDFFQGTIDRLQERAESMETRLELRKKTLYAQFTAMERALSTIQSQSDWLNAQLGLTYLQ